MQDLRAFTFAELLTAIGAKTPAPGGGAVASAVGALAAALAKMVVSYSQGRKSLAEHAPALDRAAGTLDRAAALLVDLAREDAEAFVRVNDLMKLPEEDERRRSEWLPAVITAIQPPRTTIAACADLLRLMEDLAPITNRNLRSDLAIAAILAEATARASSWNVAINLPLLPQGPDREAIETEVQATLRDITARCARVGEACAV